VVDPSPSGVTDERYVVEAANVSFPMPAMNMTITATTPTCLLSDLQNSNDIAEVITDFVCNDCPAVALMNRLHGAPV
jgi:hypothetical protein